MLQIRLSLSLRTPLSPPLSHSQNIANPPPHFTATANFRYNVANCPRSISETMLQIGRSSPIQCCRFDDRLLLQITPPRGCFSYKFHPLPTKKKEIPQISLSRTHVQTRGTVQAWPPRNAPNPLFLSVFRWDTHSSGPSHPTQEFDQMIVLLHFDTLLRFKSYCFLNCVYLILSLSLSLDSIVYEMFPVFFWRLAALFREISDYTLGKICAFGGCDRPGPGGGVGEVGADPTARGPGGESSSLPAPERSFDRLPFPPEGSAHPAKSGDGRQGAHSKIPQIEAGRGGGEKVGAIERENFVCVCVWAKGTGISARRVCTYLHRPRFILPPPDPRHSHRKTRGA
ncbi:uncharacterized protein LOC134339756 [Mobula hypostoma]|uniref:uncharacterized protein LOC134339756 n=1 Tax=Mobula hypostoma TaxID=723540 RepID=UPI002FC360B7